MARSGTLAVSRIDSSALVLAEDVGGETTESIREQKPASVPPPKSSDPGVN